MKKVKRKNEDLTALLQANNGLVDHSILKKLNKKLNEVDNDIDKLYLKFPIRKKSGGVRMISAPCDELKEVQKQILTRGLYMKKAHRCATGFIPKQSLLVNPRKHLKSKALLNIDLKNFFDTVPTSLILQQIKYITEDSIKAGLLTDKSSPNSISDCIFVICTNSYDRLPQGSPTSPHLANLSCYTLDIMLQKLAVEEGYKYTRYADDISFSTKDASKDLAVILPKIINIINGRGLIVNYKKIRFYRAHKRMEVTGVVVNQKLGIPKYKRRNFRAEVHNLVKSNKAITEHYKLQLQGYAKWISQLNYIQGKNLLSKISQIPSYPE